MGSPKDSDKQMSLRGMRGPDSSTEPTRHRLLVTHPEGSVLRLLRETLPQLAGISVETSPSPVDTFDRALSRPHDLYLFAMEGTPYGGEVLYDQIAIGLRHLHPEETILPPIIYLTEAGTAPRRDLLNQVRVKAILQRPFNIALLLKTTAAALGSLQ